MWDFDKFKSNIAFIEDSGNKITYYELDEMQKEFFNNVNERDLMFILSENSIGSLIGYCSCIQNKVVPLMLDAEIKDEYLERLIDLYKPDYIWMPEEKNIFVEGNIVFRKYGYELISLNNSEKINIYSELSLLLTTSGTTGNPKLVRLSYNNILSNTKSIVKYLELDESYVPITVLPFYYTFGLSIINTHLYVGATILITKKKIIQKSFWNFFKEHNGNSLSGVPYTFEVLRKFNFHKMELPQLKMITQAGGKLEEDDLNYLLSYIEGKNVKLFIMYGQTEATARISYVPPEMLEHKKGSIGIPIPGCEMCLVDENDNIIKKENEEGEIVCKGENVSLGYAQCKKDLEEGDVNKGILHTGDYGCFDSDKFYYLNKRKDKIVKHYGKRLNLSDLEKSIELNIGVKVNILCKEDKIIMYVPEKFKEEKKTIEVCNKNGIRKENLLFVNLEINSNVKNNL